MKRIVAQAAFQTRLHSGLAAAIVVTGILALTDAVHAQWLNQSVDLQPGWNAVFLHVDASHRTLNATVAGDAANPIQEVWRWNPPSVAQFTTSPAQPSTAADWTAWNRTNAASELQRLSGDTAYLVRVSSNATPYTWDIKGRPVLPRHSWSVSGLNLIGFPTVPATPPTFAEFFANAPELAAASPEIYRYVGGPLGATNPQLVAPPMFALTPVRRGQAFWMRSGTVFNRYFGPFEIKLDSADGIDFGETRGSTKFRIRNLAPQTLTVRLVLQSSAPSPASQPAIAGDPPLLIRTALNATNLTYGYTNVQVGVPLPWRLEPRDQPGSEVEIELGIHRAAMTQPPGSLLAGVLRFTDSLGQLQVHVPVSALVGSSAGLWVGEASVDQVAHSLKSYQRDANSAPVRSDTGNYVVTATNTSFGPVRQPYPLRLIIHNPAPGSPASLLQRVYYGLDRSTNPVVANGESALHPDLLRNARRISAAHLPWTPSNVVWSLTGRLGEQTNLTATVDVSYDEQASNPFLHTYHPDHDNRTVTFDAIQPQGVESYRLRRTISLSTRPPGDDFASLVAAGSKITGEYRETLTLEGKTQPGGGTDSRSMEARGTFQLNRVSDLPVLTLAP